ncbi:MAG: D-arabinose 5-phosphate isomerase [Denitrovibrio sp.]|nr:MAG: D-arabinose 5-phosphate isomerase [Denitrovibrio sp.]
MDVLQIAKNTIQIEIDAMYQVMEKLGDSFIEAVEAMMECKGRVIVTGMGKSGIIGRKIAATLSSTGTPSLFMHPAEGVHGDLGMMVKGDICIAISNSGETKEIVTLLPLIKRFKIPLIAIVGKEDSTLHKKCDIFLDATVSKEACTLNLAPTASTTVALALGDALSVALLERRGFRAEDFAMYHPSGSLGKQLLMRVEDLYHTGDKVPIINENMNVSDALLVMSDKGFGCTAIVDDNNKLSGIITDGDLRRGLEKFNDVFDKKIKDIGTNFPKVIEKDALAAKALQIMEEHSITSLFTVNENDTPDGIMHLHDLLREGIV